MKKILRSILSLMFLVSVFFVLSGFKLSPLKYNPIEYTYLCGFEYCPSHLWGEPSCYDKMLKTLHFNCFNEKYNINTERDIDDIKLYFENNGYSVHKYVNADKNFVTDPAEIWYHKMNRHYYMIASHGAEDGRFLLSKSAVIHLHELPQMNHNILAVFAICYGGKNGNAADYSVNTLGANNAFGWSTEIYNDSAYLFTTNFWRIYFTLANKDIDESINQTISYLHSNHFITVPENDDIYHPVLYRKNRSAKTFSLKNNFFEETIKKYIYVDGIKAYGVVNNKTNINYYGCLSNKLFNKTSSYSCLNSCYEEQTLIDSFIIPINNEYHLISVYADNNYNRIYFDTYTNKIIDLNDMINIEKELLR